jgi:hypothetical protein
VDFLAAIQRRRGHSHQEHSGHGERKSGKKLGKKLLMLRTDHGGEFAASDFVNYSA